MSPYQAELLKDVKSPIIPDLSRWSDIAYLQWAEVCKSHGTEMSNLKYVIETDNITSHKRSVGEKRRIAHAIGMCGVNGGWQWSWYCIIGHPKWKRSCLAPGST